ncbi:transcriptional regulatory protein [Burkholderia pseudomallei MSHR346]|nr:transcriptional regulatory protein [Burkholderia pseudomallei MSHR346]
MRAAARRAFSARPRTEARRHGGTEARSLDAPDVLGALGMLGPTGATGAIGAARRRF